MNFTAHRPIATLGLLSCSFLAACGGHPDPHPDADTDVASADVSTMADSTTTDDATSSDVAPADSSDGSVFPDSVNVAYLGIVGEEAPYAVIIPSNGRLRYHLTHVTAECTLVEGRYATDESTAPGGVLRVSNGARFYELDLETRVGSMDLGGMPFAMPGDNVVFATTGRGSMPFPTLSVNLRRPPAIALLAPLPRANSTIDRTQPLTIHWTPPADSTGITVHVGFFTMDLTAQNEMWCDFPAADGAVTIPASVLSQFPPGHGDISVNAHSGDVRETEGWHVRLSYFGDAIVTGATASYSATVTYQ